MGKDLRIQAFVKVCNKKDILGREEAIQPDAMFLFEYRDFKSRSMSVIQQCFISI